MDSSPVLGQQSQNKIHSDHKRMKNELNTMPANPMASKQRPVPHLHKNNSENQDPESPKNQKTPARPGLSRLPVLAKSLHLHVPSDFMQSHKRWEENSPAKKSKRSKLGTKPVPFNFSEPRTTKMAIHQKKTCTADSKIKDMNARPTGAIPKTQGVKTHLSTAQHSTRKDNPTVLNNRDLSREKEKHQGYRSSNDVAHAPKHITNDTSSTFSRSPLGLSNSSLSIPKSVSALAEPAAGTEACLNNFGLLSLKDPSKSVHSASGVNSSSSTAGKEETLHQPDHSAMLRFLQQQKEMNNISSTTPRPTKPFNYEALRVSAPKSRKKAKPTTVEFSPDPAALQSILQNEGVKAGGPTPRRGTSIYSAQRVPASRRRKENIARAMGPTNSVEFSPDPAALQSILSNEGVKAGGPTPGRDTSIYGRGTSIYTAQRVPVSRRRKETIGGAMESSQRIPDTRHGPLSSIHRRFLSASRVQYAGSPLLNAPQSCDEALQSHKEEVVQKKLFTDEEEDCPPCTSVTDGGAEENVEQLSDQHSDVTSQPEQMGEISNHHGEQESQRRAGGQPFLQAPERQSVIFFSTGKNLIRTPHAEKLGCSVLREKQNGVIQKSVAPAGSVVALLRRRKLLLEEERLDDEVSTYTSLPASDPASAPPPPAFQPPRPRCQNPVASVLHLQELTRFVPINP